MECPKQTSVAAKRKLIGFEISARLAAFAKLKQTACRQIKAKKKKTPSLRALSVVSCSEEESGATSVDQQTHS